MATINGTAGNDNLLGTAAADIINGLGGADTLSGGLGNDVLDGGLGNDTMIGGLGNDTYYVDSLTDFITENASEGTDTVYLSAATYNFTSVSIENIYLTGSAVSIVANSLANKVTGNGGNNSVDAGDGNDSIDGGAGNDTILGGLGSDIIDGGTGDDSMVGGDGNDAYYVDSVGDVVVEVAGVNKGKDLVYLSALAYNFSTVLIEDIRLIGVATTVTANSANNYITGNTLNNAISSLAGSDTIYAGAGDDTVSAGDDDDVVVGEAGNDTLNGENGHDRLLGGIGNDTLNGGAGNDSLSGGTGADSMVGGAGNDTYYRDNVGDIITEALNGGIDTVFSELSYTLGSDVENLALESTTNIDGTGNSLDNVVTGNSGNNTLTGLAGNDTLNGQVGADTMVGGTGDDRYYIDNVGDVVTENLNEGLDTIYSTITVDLSDIAKPSLQNIEKLYLLGSGTGLNATGNSLDNLLVGNDKANSIVGGAGNDILRGGGGADTLVGGTGNDIYYVDTEDNTKTPAIEGDVVTETVSQGIDTVYAEVSYLLGANVENLYLLGSRDLNATGNTENNELRGNTGNNILDGGVGIDAMYGGSGNDTYYVDSINDRTIELAGQGLDTVITAISGVILAANVENLISTANLAAVLTGNSLDNSIKGSAFNDSITGGDGKDTLNGGVGSDTMVGGIGDDIYYVDTIDDPITAAVEGDVVTELGGGGIDTVNSTVTLTLFSEVEKLVLTGVNKIDGTGNALANTLTGNNQNNKLNGLTGADTMLGGDGNDTYVVDDVGDVVTEVFNQGIDVIESSITFDLSINGIDVENLTLLTGAVNGTGNTLDNLITGNAAANNISGGAGADNLYGNAGNDTVGGGGGNDVIYGDDLADSVIGADSLNGGAGNDSLNGGQGNDTINGGADNDTLNGGLGNDSMTGGAGDDTYYVNVADTLDVITEILSEGTDTVIVTTALASYTLAGKELENLTMLSTGTATGNAYDNIIDANNGVNNGNLTGGNGNDTYKIDGTGDTVVEAAGVGTGTDIIESSATVAALAANVENLTLIGDLAIDGTGNGLGNIITGNASSNRLNGGGATTTAKDTLQGGFGDDVYVLTSATSMQYVTIVESKNNGIDYLEVTGVTTVTTDYNALTNVSAFTVNGGGITGFSATGVEGVRLGGTAAMTATGGANDDRIVSVNYGKRMIGGAGNDYLDSEGGGGEGTTNNNTRGDTMDGGNGSDTYVVSTWDYYTTGGLGDNQTNPAIQDDVDDTGTNADDIDTVIIEWTDKEGDTAGLLGTDEGLDSVNVTLGSTFTGIENLTFRGTSGKKNAIGDGNANILKGGAGANTLTGNGGNDKLYGEYGNDTLDGGAGDDTLDGGDGADRMTGGADNDTYYFNNTGDVIVADSGGTLDVVFSTVNINVAGLGIENITLQGSQAINATGTTSANIIIGNGSANVINGNGGEDNMQGGDGNDTYTVDSVGDVVVENFASGIDTVNSSISFDMSTDANRIYIENLTLTTTGTIGTGNNLANTLNARNTAVNTLIGGLGDDRYIVDQFDLASISDTVGIDSVYLDPTVSSYSYTLAANLENLIIEGIDTGTTGTGNALDNWLWANFNTIANTLTGGAGNDTYVIGLNDKVVEAAVGGGTDTVYIDDANYTGDLTNVEYVYAYNSKQTSLDILDDVKDFTVGRTLTLTSTTSALDITGSTLNDTILGGTKNDTIRGGGGSDSLNGGAGDDTYYVDGGETITDGSGTADTVISSINYSIAATASIENLTLNGTNAVNATGNTADNIIKGNLASNVLTGGAGNDTYYVNKVPYALEDYADTAASVAIYNGSSPGTEGVAKAFDNTVINSKYLNLSGGGTGVLIDLGVQRVVTALGLTSANDAKHRDPKTYTLYGSNTSTTVGMVAITAVGAALTVSGLRYNDYPNAIINNTTSYQYYRLVFESTVDNTIDENAGTAGIQSYVQIAEIRLLGVPVSDTVVELAGEGTDTVRADYSYTLTANVENLILEGTANINGTGNTLGNILTGNSGNNVLDGGTGIDTMEGKLGDDTYYVDSASDVVTEVAGEGSDTVYSSVSFTAVNIENIIATGASITITGNSSDNKLISQGSTTTLRGLAGNDLYIIDDAFDVVDEAFAGSGGQDSVQTSVNYTATVGVENVQLIEGSLATTATGNSLDNILTGNSNVNTLTGGDGNDTYFVDQTTDSVVENANQGIDTVYSSATFDLTTLVNVENLSLIGADAINGTGNALDNTLTGSTGNNILVGGGGKDTLAGGQGTDTLDGGTGNNVYVFTRDDGVDTIIESAGSDILNFSGANISYTQLWFKQTGNDLEIDLIGTDNGLGKKDAIFIKDWYLSDNNKVETISSGDAYTLSSTDVDRLVQAMSALTPPEFGNTGLPPETFDALESTFFGTWKST